MLRGLCFPFISSSAIPMTFTGSGIILAVLWGFGRVLSWICWAKPGWQASARLGVL